MKTMMIAGLIMSTLLILVGILGKTSEAFFIGAFMLLGCFMLYMTLVKAKADEKKDNKRK